MIYAAAWSCTLLSILLSFAGAWWLGLFLAFAALGLAVAAMPSEAARDARQRNHVSRRRVR